VLRRVIDTQIEQNQEVEEATSAENRANEELVGRLHDIIQDWRKHGVPKEARIQG
jgi:hypothetical protein